MVVGCQPYAPVAFTPRKYSRYSFLLEAESTPDTTLLLCGKYHLPHCIANELYGLGCGSSSLCPIAATGSRPDMEPLETPIQFVPSAPTSGIKDHNFLNDATRRHVWNCSSFHVGGQEWGAVIQISFKLFFEIPVFGEAMRRKGAEPPKKQTLPLSVTSSRRCVQSGRWRV